MGPIGRSVSDVAALLQVMVGYDASDNLTSLAQTNQPPDNYTQFLTPGLQASTADVSSASSSVYFSQAPGQTKPSAKAAVLALLAFPSQPPDK